MGGARWAAAGAARGGRGGGAAAAHRPTPKQRKISHRSLFMPSTTLPIEPSLPRSALPEPHTETKVITLTVKTLAQMQMVEKRWSAAFAT